MTNSLNSNAIHAKYGHFKNGGRQWSIDISCNCLPGIIKGLIRIVDVLALRMSFAQDVLVVSCSSRQERDR